MNLIILLLLFGTVSAEFPNSKSFALNEFKNGSLITAYFKHYGDEDVLISFYPVEKVENLLDESILAHVKLSIGGQNVLIINNFIKGRGWIKEHRAPLHSAPEMWRCDIYKMSRNALLVVFNGYYAGYWNLGDTDAAKSVYIYSKLPGVIEWSDPESHVQLRNTNGLTASLSVDDFLKYRDDPSERIVLTLNKGLPIGASINISAMKKPTSSNGKFGWNVGFHSKKNPTFYPISVGQKLNATEGAQEIYLHNTLFGDWHNSVKCSGGFRDLEHFRIERTAENRISMTVFYSGAHCNFESKYRSGHFDDPLDLIVSGGTMILNVDHSLGLDVAYN